jgi:lipoprotein signal peptidase
LVAWFLAAGVVLVLDQVTKELSQHRARTRARTRPGTGATIGRVTKARVGLGRVRDRRLLISLWLVAAFGSLLALRFVGAFQGQAAQIGLGAALGGATGNALDMVRKGAVIDFVDLRVWPTFNLADAAIVVGVVVALWSAA